MAIRQRAGIVVWMLASAVALGATVEADRDRLVAAILGPTPLVTDLEQLSDRIGGRPTGSDANRRAVDWAEARLREAGVKVRRERFQVPAGWLERSARAEVRGDGVQFSPRVAAMPYSVGTGSAGASGPIRDGGRGTEVVEASIRIVRVVDEHWCTTKVRTRHGSVISAIDGIVSVVAHHEERPGGHNERPPLVDARR